MKPRPPKPEPAPAGTLSVRLTPRASADAVTHCAGGVLFPRLTAPPVEGAANAACCQFVAKLLGVSPSPVTLKLGHKSRDKVLSIAGMTQEDVQLSLSRYGVYEP